LGKIDKFHTRGMGRFVPFKTSFYEHHFLKRFASINDLEIEEKDRKFK